MLARSCSAVVIFALVALLPEAAAETCEDEASFIQVRLDAARLHNFHREPSQWTGTSTEEHRLGPSVRFGNSKPALVKLGDTPATTLFIACFFIHSNLHALRCESIHRTPEAPFLVPGTSATSSFESLLGAGFVDLTDVSSDHYTKIALAKLSVNRAVVCYRKNGNKMELSCSGIEIAGDHMRISSSAEVILSNTSHAPVTLAAAPLAENRAVVCYTHEHLASPLMCGVFACASGGSSNFVSDKDSCLFHVPMTPVSDDAARFVTLTAFGSDNKLLACYAVDGPDRGKCGVLTYNVTSPQGGPAKHAMLSMLPPRPFPPPGTNPITHLGAAQLATNRAVICSVSGGDGRVMCDLVKVATDSTVWGQDRIDLRGVQVIHRLYAPLSSRVSLVQLADGMIEVCAVSSDAAAAQKLLGQPQRAVAWQSGSLSCRAVTASQEDRLTEHDVVSFGLEESNQKSSRCQSMSGLHATSESLFSIAASRLETGQCVLVAHGPDETALPRPIPGGLLTAIGNDIMIQYPDEGPDEPTGLFFCDGGDSMDLRCHTANCIGIASAKGDCFQKLANTHDPVIMTVGEEWAPETPLALVCYTAVGSSYGENSGFESHCRYFRERASKPTRASTGVQVFNQAVGSNTSPRVSGSSALPAMTIGTPSPFNSGLAFTSLSSSPETSSVQQSKVGDDSSGGPLAYLQPSALYSNFFSSGTESAQIPRLAEGDCICYLNNIWFVGSTLCKLQCRGAVGLVS
eukprot:gnl/TRDRNA2_/TRDRNA2_35360_c0_seq1.p1 gnl/TRDRNA2_/TRDRNA2_35360_c0~~gnl/TRDRNA2_/TRDRNA2_35360_c0_seq1.p1  ORF type:complete len:743 (-),score=80.43 gnl/TRDRNA2_/TRDRNA2_35360_c0_seq1:139-2367(-)